VTLGSHWSLLRGRALPQRRARRRRDRVRGGRRGVEAAAAHRDQRRPNATVLITRRSAAVQRLRGV
jgi:hypothetical protein